MVLTVHDKKLYVPYSTKMSWEIHHHLGGWDSHSSNYEGYCLLRCDTVVEHYHSFHRILLPPYSGPTLKMNAIGSSKMMITFYKTLQHHILKSRNLYNIIFNVLVSIAWVLWKWGYLDWIWDMKEMLIHCWNSDCQIPIPDWRHREWNILQMGVKTTIKRNGILSISILLLLQHTLHQTKNCLIMAKQTFPMHKHAARQFSAKEHISEGSGLTFPLLCFHSNN